MIPPPAGGGAPITRLMSRLGWRTMRRRASLSRSDMVCWPFRHVAEQRQVVG
ncbi:MAG: hypothetical protein HY598_01575 [Candidatus Omnitrophica bacterium]|nr:hypothetical protein [Candidatus Omnitrophota bacterium]